jgi:NADH-quinone oxidoreductase subunit M
MLGIFALTIQGMEGAILQMINHGLSTGALFLVVGMIYERRHSRMIEDFGGLARILPVFTAFFMIVTLSSIGLPGLNGFVGEFLILVGTFRVNVLYAVLATSGVILAAVYMLWMFQRVMFGTVRHDENRRLTDLTPREIVVLVPVVLCIIWIGIYPRPFLQPMEASVKQLLAQVHVRYRADDRGAESREEPTATAKRHPGGARGAEVSGGWVGSPARMSNVEFRISNVEVEQSEIPWGVEPRRMEGRRHGN